MDWRCLGSGNSCTVLLGTLATELGLRSASHRLERRMKKGVPRLLEAVVDFLGTSSGV